MVLPLSSPTVPESGSRLVLASAVALLAHYFNIHEGEAWVHAQQWTRHYSPDWVRLAVVEALYQGRYKLVSVQQILDLWGRRGKTLAHFNREFESLITVPLSEDMQASLRQVAQHEQMAHIEARRRQQRWLEPSVIPFPSQTPTPQEQPSPNPEVSQAPSPEEDPNLTPDPVALSPSSELAAPESVEPPQGDPDPDRAPSLDRPAPPVPESSATPMSQPPQRDGIHRFKPAQDSSGFDRKLLALAQL